MDFEFDGGEEASEGIITISIELTLFLDIILVVFLANGIDSEDDVDYSHFDYLG